MLRHRSVCFVGICLLASAACSRESQEAGRADRSARSTGARVRQLADVFLDGFFDRNPDAVTVYGVPGRHHDRLPDNSLDALKAWQAKEDAWLAEAHQIDPQTIEEPPLRATYAIVRETLEASAAV